MTEPKVHYRLFMYDPEKDTTVLLDAEAAPDTWWDKTGGLY